MRPTHFVVLIVVLIIIFGAAKLPDIARNIGKSAKILKKEMKELAEDEPQPQTPAIAPQAVQAPPAVQPPIAQPSSPQPPIAQPPMTPPAQYLHTPPADTQPQGGTANPQA